LKLDLKIFAQSMQGPEGLFKLIERSKPSLHQMKLLKKGEEYQENLTEIWI